MAVVGWSTEQTNMKIRSIGWIDHFMCTNVVSCLPRVSFQPSVIISPITSSILKAQLSTGEQPNNDRTACQSINHTTSCEY